MFRMFSLIAISILALACTPAPCVDTGAPLDECDPGPITADGDVAAELSKGDEDTWFITNQDSISHTVVIQIQTEGCVDSLVLDTELLGKAFESTGKGEKEAVGTCPEVEEVVGAGGNLGATVFAEDPHSVVPYTLAVRFK